MSDARRKFEELDAGKREKVIGDVYCMACEQSSKLEEFEVLEFRGTLMIAGSCPRCGGSVTKPV
jgi:uncharacterized Zn finger protein (UPF0148 family)